MTELINNIRSFIGNDLIFGLIVSVLIVLIFVLLAKIFSFLIRKIVRPFVNKSETLFDDKILHATESASFRLIVLAGLYLAVENFRESYLIPGQEVANKLLKDYPILKGFLSVADYLLYIVTALVILLLSYRLITILFDWYAEKINAGANRDLSGSVFPLLKKVSKILLAALAIVIILSKFNVNISGFLVSLGVGSLAIALAMQDTLSNMIAGFIIMIDKPFRIGDRIKYGDDLGDVVEIGIRSTKIMDFDNNLVIMPNNEIVKTKIVNVTYPNILTRIIIEVGVAYGTDIKKVREIMIKAANEHEFISKQVPPDVNLLKFGDSSLDVRLTARTDDYRNAWAMQCELREKIYEEFNKSGIEIPFPQRVVHLQKDDPSK
ncbi:MAG TPA: mechanosensitive ion channel family protein [Ignavibacteriaceae bacterium]|nr:mechanosensitive ion channel family protein [Ignavibacteriaceae bacterium]